MKLFTKILGLTLLTAMAACSTSRPTASLVDDIYYTPQIVRPSNTVNTEYIEVTAVEVPGEEIRQETSGSSYIGNDNYQGTGYYYDSQGYIQEPDTTTSILDSSGNIYLNNYYYGDYYDYAYSSRLRRFYGYSPMTSYYDPFYTDMYWYNFDPFYSGVSIYMGYGAQSFYYPGYYWNPSLYWGSSLYGYGYNPWYSNFWYGSPFGLNYWSSPYYHPYYYAYGYGSGYYNGYYNNPYYYQYLYNSYDQSNYHYGPRNSMGSTTTRTREASQSETFAERFETRTVRNAAGVRENAVSEDRAPSRTDTRNNNSERSGQDVSSRPQRTATSPDRTIEQPRTGDSQTVRRPGESGTTISQPDRTATQPQRADTRQQTGTQTRPDASSGTRPQTGTVTRPQASPQSGTTTRPQTNPSRQGASQVPAQRYVRPEQTTPSGQQGEQQPNYAPPRTYTSPSYQQPRSNEQYRNPQTTRPATVTPPSEAVRTPAGNDAQPQRQQYQPQTRPQNNPAQQGSPQQQAQPQRQDRGQPSYSPPTRSTPSVQPSGTPSRSPSRSPSSTPSMSPSRSSSPSSSPARSSGSSAAPARSSGGGSAAPARSSGSSSSRGRN